MDLGLIQISKVISMEKDNDNVQNMTIAFVGSGINIQDQELKRAPLQSLRVRVQANRHASIDNYCSHSSSLDTQLAIEFHRLHPQSKILSIQVHTSESDEDKSDLSFPNISVECIIAGIEVATLAGAQIIYLSVRTTNAKDIILLRKCCSKVSEQGRLVLTSEHNKPSRLRDFRDIYTISSNPIPIPSTFLSPQDFSLQNIFYAHPKLFSKSPLRGQIFYLTNEAPQESINNSKESSTIGQISTQETSSFFQYTAQVLSQIHQKLKDKSILEYRSEMGKNQERREDFDNNVGNIRKIGELHEGLVANGMFYIPLPLVDERL